MLHDPLSDALNVMKTNERVGKSTCTVKPASKLIREVLRIFQKHGYIGQFEFIDDGKSGQFKVQLIGRINGCGAIKPRFAVGAEEWPKWEQRYIPSKDFGIIIVSTTQGLMTNREAREKMLGGRLVVYIY